MKDGVILNNQKTSECTNIVGGQIVPMWADTPEKECILEVSKAFEPYKETIRHLKINNFLERERDMLNAVVAINEVTTKLIESVSVIANSFAKAISGLKIKLP